VYSSYVVNYVLKAHTV